MEVTKAVRAFVKRHTHKRMCVSVCGKVNSMVLLSALKTHIDNTKTILCAVHVHDSTNDEEIRFIQWFCELHDVPLDIRHVWSQSARLETYRKQRCPILLGHDVEDALENILSNVASRHNYDNMKGMAPLVIQNDICIMRPLLHVTNTDIRTYADVHGVPHIPSALNSRGTLRDHVIPALGPQLQRGLLALSEHVQDLHRSRDRM